MTDRKLADTPVNGVKRWYRADNIRYILLFNVIMEHMLTQTGCTQYPIITLVVNWSRLITMPGFCFLSGYFSKKTDKCYETAISDFLLPYLVFNTLFVLIFGQGADSNNFLSPTFVYWYFLSMFTWKIMARALMKMRFILPLSFVMALAAGSFVDVHNFLSLSRTIVFLPYFLLGMKMSREDVAKIENLPKALVIPLVALTLAGMGWLNLRGIYDHEFYYNWNSYAFFGLSLWQGLGLRLLGFAASSVLVVGLFSLVPDRSLPVMRDGGRRTMVPYVLHPYIIMDVRYLVAFLPAMDRWYIMLPLAIGMGVGLMTLLGLPALDELYKDIFNFLKKIFFPQPREETRS